MSALAFTDLSVGILLLPSLVSVITTEWHAGELVCRLTGYGLVSAMYMTVILLCSLAIDRYILIFFPLRYTNLVKKQYVFYIIILLWFYSLVTSYIYTMPHSGEYVQYISAAYHCSFNYGRGTFYWLRALFIFFTVTFPCSIIILGCYLKILAFAWKQQKTIQVEQSIGQVQSPRISFKSLHTVLVITGALVVTWAPITIYAFVVLFRDLSQFSQLQYIAYNIMYSNNFINWVVYMKTQKNFRSAQIKMFQKIKHNICDR